VFDTLIPTKFSKDLVVTIDYVVANLLVDGLPVFASRSNFIRSACIAFLRSKLGELDESSTSRKF